MRVVVQQRHRLYREGLSELLSVHPDLTVVGKVGTVAQLVAACAGEEPDVAVLDWAPEEPSSQGTVELLRRTLPALRIVVLGDFSQRAAPDPAAPGTVLVSRAGGVRPILEAIRSTAPVATATPFRRPPAQGGTSRPRSHDPRRKPLTPREATVLALIGSGHTSGEVAARLCISRKTVDNHKQRIFTKLAVQSQAHAVAVALAEGFLVHDAVTGVARGVAGRSGAPGPRPAPHAGSRLRDWRFWQPGGIPIPCGLE